MLELFLESLCEMNLSYKPQLICNMRSSIYRDDKHTYTVQTCKNLYTYMASSASILKYAGKFVYTTGLESARITLTSWSASCARPDLQ